MSAAQTTSQTLDQVILVDEFDNQIGVMDKVAAHRGHGQRHRASSVLLFNDQGELLIQQRSAQKIVGAHQWANTCCGNVRPGESYLECALRRLREELGVTAVKLRRVGTVAYQVSCNEAFSEHEIDVVFVGHYSGPVFPNAAEVTQYQWILPLQLMKELVVDQKTLSSKYVPWLSLVLRAYYEAQSLSKKFLPAANLHPFASGDFFGQILSHEGS